MKLLFFLLGLMLIMPTCHSSQKPETLYTTSKQAPHEIIVLEVIQVSAYSYLKCKENDKEIWLAVKKMEIKIGEKYYYTSGMEMKNFTSKELNRTFDSILFLESVSSNPEMKKENISNSNQDIQQNPHEKNTSAPSIEGKESTKGKTDKRESVKVSKADDGITIAELFSNPKFFEGKTVKIKAQVTKFSDGIMNRNWIHLQDGTESQGKFDLTATSNTLQFKVGDIVTLEGKITLNKDFGYGYFYEVIMEEVVQK